MLRLILFITLLSIQGCTTLEDMMNPSAAAVTYGCTYQDGHYSEYDIYISAGYKCPVNSPKFFLYHNGCTWVNSYYRKNGDYVMGHHRCSIPRFNYSSGSNCHSVNSYYRKDGTFVSGHTRCR